jgi:AcrR family transcriptional regulator
MAEILAEADLTKGALYFHFKSKEELARTVLAAEENWSRLLNEATDRPVQDIINFTHLFAIALQTDPVIRASIRMAVEYGTFSGDQDFTTYRVWTHALVAPFELARAARQLRDDVRVDDLAEIVVGSVTGLQIQSQAVSQRRDLRERITKWWTVFLPGIVPSRTIGRYQPAGTLTAVQIRKAAVHPA